MVPTDQQISSDQDHDLAKLATSGSIRVESGPTDENGGDINFPVEMEPNIDFRHQIWLDTKEIHIIIFQPPSLHTKILPA